MRETFKNYYSYGIVQDRNLKFNMDVTFKTQMNAQNNFERKFQIEKVEMRKKRFRNVLNYDFYGMVKDKSLKFWHEWYLLRCKRMHRTEKFRLIRKLKFTRLKKSKTF